MQSTNNRLFMFMKSERPLTLKSCITPQSHIVKSALLLDSTGQRPQTQPKIDQVGLYELFRLLDVVRILTKRNPHRPDLTRCHVVTVIPMRILQAPPRVLEEAFHRSRAGTSFTFAPLLDLREIPSPPFPPPNVGGSAQVVQFHLPELHKCSCDPDFPFQGSQRQGCPKLVDCSWFSKEPR